uniref:Aldose 1-epimerase n=2 Tax=Magallana gigas TaxID=29159 RepID=A0A8W8IE36_MAGGI|nr:aldose 1-epimerase [Crassostrea gigas]
MTQSPALPVQDSYGRLSDGREVYRYSFTNSRNVTVRVINYGCVITDILVPDKDGNIDDISIGYDKIEDYEPNPRCFGSICGRVVNVISNGKFVLDGKEYSLPLTFSSLENEAPKHAIHGGVKGFHLKLFESWIDGDKVKMKYVSPDGEEGFPGELTTIVSYQLTNQNELVTEYSATTTKTTIVNFTNHAYFNLQKHDYPNIDDHVLQISADKYTVNKDDDIFIPSGELRAVADTPFDFRKPVRLGDRLKEGPHGRGFFHNFCLGESGPLKQAAVLDHPPTGRRLEVLTTEPGMHLYTGCNTIPHTKGKDGAVYEPFCSVCLETQHYPDTPTHQDKFPSIVLRPGENFYSKTIFKFGLIPQ